MADTLTPEQTPVNQPQSGTYGEKAELRKLQQSLPEGAIGQPAPAPGADLPPIRPLVQPTKQTEGRPQTGGRVPPGVSPALLMPTDRPDTPVSTPLADQFDSRIASPQIQTPQQGRLLVLERLANSPNVSAETREWAEHILEILIGGPGVRVGA